jgi:hypothetical protein
MPRNYQHKFHDVKSACHPQAVQFRGPLCDTYCGAKDPFPRVATRILPFPLGTVWAGIAQSVQRRSADRIPVGVRFSAPVSTGPEAYPTPTLCVMGSYPGVKRPTRGVDHPHPFSAEVKERVELYLYSISGPSWPVLG